MSTPTAPQQTTAALELQADGLIVRLSFSLQPCACYEFSAASSAAYAAPPPLEGQLKQLQAMAQAAMPRLHAAFQEATSIVQQSFLAQLEEEVNSHSATYVRPAYSTETVAVQG